MWFRATLNFRKFKVALNLMYRIMCLVHDEIGANIGTRGVEWSFRKSGFRKIS